MSEPTVQTRHWNEDGEQITERVVTIADAVGYTYRHRFRAADDGTYEYLGAGEPPASAVEALDEYEADE